MALSPLESIAERATPAFRNDTEKCGREKTENGITDRRSFKGKKAKENNTWAGY